MYFCLYLKPRLDEFNEIMAKFTVIFKDRTIQSAIFDQKTVHIGSDTSNDIIIDSLAIAPAHAAVCFNEEETIIKQLNDDFPISINNNASKECKLNNNDEILIGKHKIIYNTNESIVNPAPSEDANNFASEQHLPEANLQIMEGKHIGRLIPLKKSMTRIGHSGNGVVVIAKRTDGYYISSLESNESLTINDKLLKDESIKLNANDMVVIDETPMQFFLG